MRKIKLYWFNAIYNLGDVLNPLLFKKLFDIPVVRSKVTKADCVAIGSNASKLLKNKFSLGGWIRKMIRKPIKVWGTGFIEPEVSKSCFLSRKLDVYAVRGKLTLNRLQKYTAKNLSNVVLGDPGLLVSKLFDMSKIEKKYELGIIPHYVDANSPLLKNIQVKNSIVIDVTAPVEQTLILIASCKHIISSAMHGLIVADSFGIPNIRMELSNAIAGGDYKFRDYYSALDMDLPDKILMTQDTKITDTKFISDNYKVPQNKVQEICKELIRVFPYKY